MREFRKIIDLPAVKLKRTDIEELAQLLVEATPDLREDPLIIEPHYFSVNVGDSKYKGSSIEELLSHNLPDVIDELEIEVNGWAADRGIDRGVTVNVDRRAATAHIHATDEIWYLGTTKKIEDFFRKRRLWYSGFHSLLPAAAGMGIGASVASLVALGTLEEYLTALIPLATALVLMYCSAGIFDGRMFPYGDIRLNDHRKLDALTLSLVVSAIGVVATVGSMVLQLVQVVNQ